MRYIFILLAVIVMAGCAPKVAVKASQSASTAVASSTPVAVVSVTKIDPAPIPELSVASVPLPQDLDKRQLTCLADSIYYEARGEDLKGQEGVGYVVMNRVKARKWPNTICGVVYQCTRASPHSKRKVCQFGWASRKHRITDFKAYAHAQDLARLIMLGVAPNPIGHCTYFHSTAERTPRGVKYAIRKRIDHHIFYAYHDELVAI